MKRIVLLFSVLLLWSTGAFGQCVAITNGTQCVGPNLVVTPNGVAPPTAFQLNIGGTPPVGLVGQATLSTLNNQLVVDFNKTGYFAIPTLDASAHLPLSIMPVLAESSIVNLVSDLAAKVASTKIGAVSGVAPLDAAAKVPLVNLPILDVGRIPVLPESNITGLVTDLAARVPTTALGVTVATLDGIGRLPVTQLPVGVVTLDGTGKVPLSQLPPMGSAGIPANFSCTVAVVNLSGTAGWIVNFSNCQ